ncbi:5825_t:CDS:2, partial [Ambispora gerdemannii]
MSSDTISSKILTDDYCKWHANLVDLPSSQTDKICSRLYKAYMEEIELNPWINSLKTQIRIPQMNVLPISPKRQFPISVLPNNPEERQQH